MLTDVHHTPGSSPLQVSVKDLEWSLTSIMEARQRLRTAGAQQHTLLKLLNKVIDTPCGAKRRILLLRL
jgi:hypothetical protein